MRKFATTLSVLAIAVSSAFATVSAEVKVASVNMQELFVMFHKRIGMQERLQKEVAAVREEIGKREEKLKALLQQLNDIKKQSDPTLSEQAVAKLRAQAMSIQNELVAENQEYETFKKRRELALSAIQQKEFALLLREVYSVIKEVAETEGVDIVIDTSAKSQLTPSPFLVPSFPYVKPNLSITEKVAAKLNVNAPADFDAKAELQKARGEAAEQQDTPDESDASPAPNPTPAPPVR